jgi:monothiol glutaredoxin
MTEQWKTAIEEATKNNKIMVYMRGTPEAPRCGFSARVVKVLNDTGIPYATADMDSDPALWQALTALNDWPTSPQIYINGEFVGGCDILMEMNRNGELKQMLGLA